MNRQADDQAWMQCAIEMANQAALAGEVPVGAVLVKESKLLASGFNQSIQQHDPTGHAEITVLRKAAASLGNYRLPDTTLYVTLEPCCMCAGAIIQARIARVVFGAYDPKAGACGSVFNIFESPYVNHHPCVTGNILGNTCGELLTRFFQSKRLMRKARCTD